MSATFWWKAASDPISVAAPAPPASSGTLGATGTRTVTRTLASVVPPSPLATRWKLVELDGETVWVPLTLTGPMPSIDTDAALVVRQLRTTDWPRSTASGSAVRLAVGAGVDSVAVGPRLAGFTGPDFLWQPAKTARPTAKQSAERTDLVRKI